jgi:hypothetical protein
MGPAGGEKGSVFLLVYIVVIAIIIDFNTRR